MDKIKDLRHGRHCASAMHVHLVFVTKRRHCIFDGQAIEALRAIFSKVCTDFQAQLVELDGQRDHVHLLVNYPPKVSVSSLVNSLKGVSSYVLRRRLPRIAKCYSRRMFCGRLLISPHPVAAHHSTSSSATLNSRRHRYSRGLPGLKSEACATRGVTDGATLTHLGESAEDGIAKDPAHAAPGTALPKNASQR